MMNYALIGCGNIAQKSIIPAFNESKTSTLVVGIDPSSKRCREIEQTFKIPSVTTFNEAQKLYNFDAVYIAAPNGYHKSIILEAASYHKHILCEKSIVCSLDEAIEVIDYCENKDVALFEGFMYQFHDQHDIVNNKIKSSTIGEPFHIEAWFGFPPLLRSDFRYSSTKGGGAVLDAGAYTIHFARHFFNKEPFNVYSTLFNKGEEIEIRGTVMLDFGDGQTAHLSFGFDNMYQNKYSIWGTKGLLTLNRAFALPPDFQSTLYIEKQGVHDTVVMPACNHFIKEIDYFTESIGDRKIISEWRDEILSQAKVISFIKKG